jgi:DNA-binding CsgD family transcriptional regulator
MTEIGDRVVELHRLGLRSIDIAHRLNVAQSTVHYHLRKLSELSGDRSAKGPGPPPPNRSQTRALVAALLARGISRSDVARRLGLAKSTVTYHAAKLGQQIDRDCAKRIDWPLVQAYYDEGHSVRDCVRSFGFSSRSWHAAVKRGVITPRPAFKPLDEVFATNTRRSRGHLKQRLLLAGIKDGHCERCGISDWLGAPIAVALHHVNGDRYDNRIDNLVLLCPNCHSQTDTFGGRNGRRAESGAA